jgi:hypothetical protein
LCAVADQKIRGAQLAFDPAKHLRWTIAFDFTDDRHAGADARVRSRFRRPLRLRRDLFNDRTFRLLDDVGRTCGHALILLGALLLKLFNMSTSPFRRMTVRCEADIPIIGPVFASTKATIPAGRPID